MEGPPYVQHITVSTSYAISPPRGIRVKTFDDGRWTCFIVRLWHLIRSVLGRALDLLSASTKYSCIRPLNPEFMMCPVAEGYALLIVQYNVFSVYSSCIDLPVSARTGEESSSDTQVHITALVLEPSRISSQHPWWTAFVFFLQPVLSGGAVRL